MQGMPDLQCKVVLLGSAKVGKSSLIRRYITPSDSKPNSSENVDFISKTVKWKENKVKLQIWDTVGLDNYRATTASYFRGADAIILVYDVTKSSTFDDLKVWMDKMSSVASPQSLIYIIGNKCDLMVERVISSTTAAAATESLGAHAYLETSATEDVNVTELFERIISDLVNLSPEDRLQRTTSTVRLGSDPIPDPPGCKLCMK